MFGGVTHRLDAAARQMRSLFTSFTFCNITISCSLIPKENIRCSITCVSLIEKLATINLYYNAVSQRGAENPKRTTQIRKCPPKTFNTFLDRSSMSVPS